jgi:pyruvate dehydrogenase E2 component (dihydrolipoamide acetyltransferase)
MPLVRKLARERGIDLATVTGSGPGGTITRADLDRVPATKAPPPAEERVPLTRLRRTIAEHMSRSWSEIPHVTVFEQFDAGRLLHARAALAHRVGSPLPLEALILKAVIPVLVEHPEFNATVDGDALVIKRHYDVAVAVDTSEGLMVPVVHGADSLGVADLAGRIFALAEQARNRTLSPESVTGATFTVSNIGAVGGAMGTPIIPYGTTAILSVGQARVTPVVRDEAVVVAQVASLSLSYDHRVIDGGLGQRFMGRLVENLEEPALFLA